MAFFPLFKILLTLEQLLMAKHVCLCKILCWRFVACLGEVHLKICTLPHTHLARNEPDSFEIIIIVCIIITVIIDVIDVVTIVIMTLLLSCLPSLSFVIVWISEALLSSSTSVPVANNQCHVLHDTSSTACCQRPTWL